MTERSPSMPPRTFALALFVIVAGALVVRAIFPAADPPWNPTVGVVWHDEGAWVHNARNRALFGTWTTDAWNPMYVAPVFTALEYLSFEAFGVGVRQARLVSEVTGLFSVLLLGLGVARLAGRDSGLMAAALLATNYVYVMYNRAATMEASMVAFMVFAWYCYVRAQTQPAWGWLAAACALLAYFTKASAAFFVAALGVDVVLTSVRPGAGDGPASIRAARITVVALAVWGLASLALFVAPNWTEYRFYNWQMSVTRKPSYDLRSLVNRVTWFPIVHDIFTRMWLVTILATAALGGMAARWRRLAAPERLLGLWIGLGALELVLHDVGNERRFVVFIPPFVALASILLGRDRRLLGADIAALSRRHALVALPAVLFALYLLSGAIVRLAFLYQVQPGVRLSAALAVLLAAALYATWPALPRRLARDRWSPSAGLAVAAIVVAGQTAQFVQWAAGRTYKNYEASVQLGRVLPPGTLVHGKLANGLALENRIRPVFVGRGFGNYEDRKSRDDVRYILTYIAPRIGYEGPVIQDVLDAYPNRRILMTFDVAETTTGHDRAALIDKFGAARAGGSDGIARAHD